MKSFIVFIYFLNLILTVWSVDKTQSHQSSPQKDHSSNQSPVRFHGLSYTGNGVEKHLQRQKVPKEERANVRWKKLKEFTGIRAKALTKHLNDKNKMKNKLDDPIYKANHKAKHTRHHENNIYYHDTKEIMVQGYNDILHAAEKDLKTYQSYNGDHVPKHASVQSLRQIIRQEHPTYVSPPPSPVGSSSKGYQGKPTSSS